MEAPAAGRLRRRLGGTGRLERARWREWGKLGASSDRFALVQARETYIVRVGDEAIGRDLYVHGEFDFATFVKALGALDRPRVGTLVDIGANIGPICIPAVARGLADRAIAIEPEPLNFALLEANVRLNGLTDHITCVQAAAGAQHGGVVSLELAAVNFGDHRVSATSEASSERGVREALTAVPVVVLDDLVTDPDPGRDLLWMDVQGYEMEVLRGSSAVLAQGIPIVMELQPMLLHEYGGIPDLLDVLDGYRAFRDLRKPSSPRPLSELPDLYASLGLGGPYTDVLITP